MGKRLTAIAVAKLRPNGPRRRELPDAGSGLYLVVHRTGRKTWSYRFRRPDGRTANLKLGSVDTGVESPDQPVLGGHLTLGGARQVLAETKRALARGVDPAAEHYTRKRTMKWEAQIRAADTYRAAAENFIKKYAQAKELRGWRDTARTLGLKFEDVECHTIKGGLADKWKSRPVTSITKRDIVEVLDGVNPYTGNAILVALRRFFNWLHERGQVTTSPCVGIKLPKAIIARDRVLSDNEVVATWRASLKHDSPVYGGLVRFLLTNGVRRDEASMMERNEIDGDWWTIPKERSKNKHPHLVPISTLAQQVLDAVPMIGERFVFTNDGDTAASNFSKHKRSLDELALVELREIEGDKAAMKDWKLHDLRRTVASNLQRLGYSIEVVGAVLNHRSGIGAAVTQIYARHDFKEEKKAALEAWGRRLMELVGIQAIETKEPVRARK